ncbi:AAA family ATPase [Candidatus Bathyarchaeota archaeon]|nr:AAA family ATPase [Candidatus Bathyarchaeota archaeon]
MKKKRINPNPFFIIITGTPGTGKTTISKLLSEDLGLKHIELTRLASDYGLIIEKDLQRQTDVVDIWRLFDLIKKMVKKEDTPVILDGHFAHEYITAEYYVLVLVLRRAPWSLYNTLKNRGYSKEKIWENIESEIMGICSKEARENYDNICEIDTTQQTVEVTVEKIKKIIEGKDSCSERRIDWLVNEKTLDLLKDRGKCI